MSIASLKEKFTSAVSKIDNEAQLAKKVAAISATLHSTPTILANDFKVDGELSSKGAIEVEGYVKGKIRANIVTIKQGGFIEGEVFADSLNISGKFDGTIHAKSVNLTESSEIKGQFEYETLFVEDGASIDGQFKKIEIASIKDSL